MTGPFDAKSTNVISAGETLRMLRDNILLEPLDWQPSHVIDLVRFGRPLRGIIRSIGPGTYEKRYDFKTDDKTGQRQRTAVRETSIFRPTDAKVGDVVELGGLNIYDGEGYKFEDLMIDGKTHLICREADVCGVTEHP